MRGSGFCCNARKRHERRTLSDPVEDIADSPYSQQVDGPVFPKLPGRQGNNVVHLRLVLPETAPDSRAEEGVVVDEGGGDGPQVRVDTPLDDAVQGLVREMKRYKLKIIKK